MLKMVEQKKHKVSLSSYPGQDSLITHKKACIHQDLAGQMVSTGK